MANIIATRFRKTGKLAYMNVNDEEFKIGDNVVGSSERGIEIARVVKVYKEFDKKEQFTPYLRKATKYDLEDFAENIKKAEEMVKIAKEKASNLKLSMKILLAEYTLDRSKVIIYFTADERVDFRELVKLLLNETRSRIELRQIGPRDEVKVYPNIGICGRETCCRTFLTNFDSISIKDAKDQGLQINMSKLSGACGRLLCCLKYEENVYKENVNKLPKYGEVVTVKETGKKGKVVNSDILKLKVKVKFIENENEFYDTFELDKLSFKKDE